jgi:hypothetical protein
MSYSKACCTIPPVESNYSSVGTIEKVGELDCYVVGPAVSLAWFDCLQDVKGILRVILIFLSLVMFRQDAKKAIVIIYDIFGLQ